LRSRSASLAVSDLRATSLAAIFQEIAQRMERDRAKERRALSRIARELSLLRAELRRERSGNGHAAKAEADAEVLIV
jgi:hypothetical protein